MAKEIPLTRGLVALVSDEDADMTQWNWHVSAGTDGYGHRATRSVTKGRKHNIWLHREIAMRMIQRPLNRGECVLHLNGNKLDNRRENLAIVPRTEITNRAQMRHTNTSGYKGVSWHKRAQKWIAILTCRGISRYCGLFDTPEEAAHAYDEKARKYFGSAIRLNFPREGEQQA